MALPSDKTFKELMEDRRFHREMVEPPSHLRGRPLDVDFLGFRSNTYVLQQAGWLIAESVDHINGYMRLALQYPQSHLYGMSNPVSRSEVYHNVHRNMMSYGIGSPYGIVIELHIAHEIQIRSASRGAIEFDPQAFIPVDCRPTYETGPGFLMSNATYFRPIEGGKEIFLKEATMEEILHVALSKQEPEQARIREARRQEARRENYQRGGDVRAKLIAI